MKFRVITFFTLLVGLCFWIVVPAHGQELGVAQRQALAGDVPEGTIVSNLDGTYTLSSEAYDKSMVGVVSLAPPIELIFSEAEAGTVPVLSQGIVNVRVNGENGPIVAGDMITSSSSPGVGMKATKTGFILGIAQDNYAGNEESLLPVSLSIKLAFGADSPESEKIGARLVDVLKLSSLSALTDPVSTLRYVLAAGIIIVSLLVTFLTVGRVARGGVEAIGRNPLAKGTIMTSILINSVLSLGIIGMGMAAAYIITTL